MKRRQAVHKIEALPEASPDQLAKFDDVCAICYQELSTARITRCNHYFHGVCLRKWLYVQDICPLCHETLYVMTDEPNGVPDVSEHEEGNGVVAENLNNGDVAVPERELANLMNHHQGHLHQE